MKQIWKLCIAGVFVLSGASAMAQDTQEEAAAEPVAVERIANGTRFGAWTVTCEALAVNETACLLTQRLVRSSDNAFLAEVLAFWSGDASQAYLAARVPNGVFFPSGFAVKPEGVEEQTQFIWQSCARDLCEALLELDAATLEKLEAAESLVAGYRPNLRADPLVFRMSLEGAKEGLDALKASMAK